MARPTKEASQASQALGTPPDYSVYGFGTAFDLYGRLIPELQGVNLIRDMAAMAETDETIGAMMYCIETTMRQIDYSHKPRVDGKANGEDPEAVKYADLMNQILMDMDRPFADHVEDALTMIWAGFAPCEIVTKQRLGDRSNFTDGFYGIRALNLLDQSTIIQWKYDEFHNLVAFQQMGRGIGSTDGVIPLSKVLHYRVGAKYNKPDGRPLFLPAWRAWRLKKMVQDSEAIGIERELCGLPIFDMPQEVIDQTFEVDANGDPTAEAKKAKAMVAAAQAAVRDMRFNRSGGLLLPSDPWGEDVNGDRSRKFDFRIMTTSGQRSIDARTVVRDYDFAIARTAMMQFLTLGQRSGGSFGLSDDQSSIAVAAIAALCRKIVDEWNLKAIPLIWRINGWPDKYRPAMEHSDVNKNGLAALGQFLNGLGKAETFWANDKKMRAALARIADLDYDESAVADAASTAQKAAETAAEPPPAPVVAPGGAPGGKPAAGGKKPAAGGGKAPAKKPAAAQKAVHEEDGDEDPASGL